ncbi:type IV secretory system conjugative DNA transfer family protein [Rudanella lutea]|uniref:type IV secretory system conjugative DNA transfer family protein n=1 Tax=Rudanella lutea TaxID=451374 RepID=UPI000372501D|nr:type IV secretory system conjugative DNA transfer family protein [Rudanella lutea]
MNQNRNAVLLLATVAGLLAAGEYYLLLHIAPQDAGWYVKLLNLYSRGGWLFRLLFAALVPLSFALPDDTKSFGSGRPAELRRDKRPPLKVQLGVLAGYVVGALLLAVAHRFPYQFAYMVPVGAGLSSLFGIGVGQWLLRPQPKRPIVEDKKAGVAKKGFEFRTTTGGYIKVPNPFRGVFITGGPGSGKSESLAKPFIRQAIEQDYCGILYDVKFPELTKYAYHYRKQNPDATSRFCVLNFQDMNRTHRLNPIAPENLLSITYAEEYALALLKNLQEEIIEKQDFWSRSCTAVLTGLIWYLRKHHPAQCTLPHVVTLITKMPYDKLMTLIGSDSECLSYVMSVITAIGNKSADQLSGVIGTLQNILAKLATPEVFWVMSATDEGFSMDLNNPENPIFLCLGGDRELIDALRPLLGLYTTVAVKRMNRQGKHHSILLLDEAPTIYIPNFEQIPATGRSSQIATVYMCQDLSQVRKYYGEKESQMILGTLSNQFYGAVSSAETAKYVSQLIGKHEVITPEETRDNSPAFDIGSLFDAKHQPQRNRRTIAYRKQERPIVNPEDLHEFDKGEFIGFTVESKQGRFWGRIALEPEVQPVKNLPKFSTQHDLQTNMDSIVLDCATILGLEDTAVEKLLSAVGTVETP